MRKLRKRSRRGRFVYLSREALKGLAKTVKLHPDRFVVDFLRSYKSNGKAQHDSVLELIEKLNSIYWNDVSLGQREKAFFRDTYMQIKEEADRTPPPSKPKRQSPGKLTLDEIKRRQKQRGVHSMSDLKDQLIKLGSKHKNLRPNLRVILKALEASRTKAASLNPLKKAVQDVGQKWTSSQKRIQQMMGELDERDIRTLIGAAQESIALYDEKADSWGGMQYANKSMKRGYEVAKRYRRQAKGEIDRREQGGSNSTPEDTGPSEADLFNEAFTSLFDRRSFSKWYSRNERTILKGNRNIKEVGLENRDRNAVTIKMRNWVLDDEFDQRKIGQGKKEVEKAAKRLAKALPDVLRKNVSRVEVWWETKNYFYAEIKFNRP